MPLKASILISFTSAPANLAFATSHSGGWSEGFWFNQPASAIVPLMPGLMQLRSRFLPKTASVIGYRLATYSVQGNKLIPVSAQSAQSQNPGNPALSADLPQCAIEMSGTSVGSPNTNRLVFRGIADEAITGGEFNGEAQTAGGIANYTQALLNAAAGFMGRNLSAPNARVLSIQGLVVTLNANVGGVNGVDFLRLHRVYDIDGNPIKGSFLINTVVGPVYTLFSNPGGAVTSPSGTARIDGISFQQNSAFTIARTVSKKVGRPFAQYRGRRSRARV